MPWRALSCQGKPCTTRGGGPGLGRIGRAAATPIALRDRLGHPDAGSGPSARTGPPLTVSPHAAREKPRGSCQSLRSVQEHQRAAFCSGWSQPSHPCSAHSRSYPGRRWLEWRKLKTAGAVNLQAAEAFSFEALEIIGVESIE